RQPREAAQRREREAREREPLDVEVVLGLPGERELGHLLGAHATRPHRAPDRPARAADDLCRLEAGLLERARHPDQRHGRAAASGGDQRETLSVELRDWPRLERGEDRRRIYLLWAIDEWQ